MKAVVKYAYEDRAVEVRDVAEPVMSPDQVLLKVQAVGVCGSDVHMWREHQSWKINLPLVLGHEFSAVVADVGANVTGFAVGDRVACETAATVCGQCTYCLSGDYNLCPHRLGYGALDRRIHDRVCGGPPPDPASHSRPCALRARGLDRTGLRGHERAGGKDRRSSRAT